MVPSVSIFDPAFVKPFVVHIWGSIKFMSYQMATIVVCSRNVFRIYELGDATESSNS